MQLQNAGRHLRRHGTPKGSAHRRLLFPPAGEDQHPPRLHDLTDPHGQRLPRHLSGFGKKSGVGLNGTLRQVHAVRPHREAVRRLIEPDVAVAADAQQLHVNAAHAPDQLIIAHALCLRIRREAVRHMGVGHVDVHMLKKIPIHKVPVALAVFGGQPQIFVQIHALHAAEIQLPRLESLH